jgi:hypothetical protein
MVYLATILVFVLVVFFYMHVSHQRRVIYDKEVAYLDIKSPAVLDEVCELRVPFIFNRPIDNLRSAGLTFNEIKNSKTQDYILLHELSGNNMVSSMQNWQYFVENIDDNSISASPNHVLKHSMFDKVNRKYEQFLRPYMCILTENKVIIGNNKSTSGYNCSSSGRRFYTCTDGEVEVRLILPENTSDCDDKQNALLNSNDYVSVVLKSGSVLSVPPAIYANDKSVIMEQQYRSIINLVANIDTLGLSLLKRLNVQKKITMEKPMSISEGILSSVSHVK